MRKTAMKRAAVIAAAAVSAAVLFGCGGKKAETTAASAATEAASEAETEAETEAAAESTQQAADEALSVDKLVFTYVTSPLNVPSIVEKNLKTFENTFEGVEVEFAEITSGADQTQALASGDVQVLYAVGGTSVILSAANGADIKVVNMYSRSPKAFCLYAKDDSIKSPEDLKGKTVAGPAGTNLHELLAAYLASAGMTMDDVNYVSMGIPDAKAGLDGGSVDAALLAGAAAYNCEKAGCYKVTDGEGLIKAIIAVAVTNEFYEAHPDVMEKLAEAQESIVTFMKENEEEALQMTADELDLDIEAVKDMYGCYDFSLEISEDDIAGFQKTADFMYNADMIDEEFDVHDLF